MILQTKLLILFMTIIKGPKDGKHIYVALSIFYKEKGTSYFKESDDNGKTWKPEVRLSQDDQGLTWDMIYILETKRIFIFYSDYNNTVFLKTRPPESEIFSKELPIAPLSGNDITALQARYSIINSKTILSVVANIGDKEIIYIKSMNNGLVWSKPKTISQLMGPILCGMAADFQVSSRVFVLYGTRYTDYPIHLIYTEDFGETFSNPINILEKQTYNERVGGSGMVMAKNIDNIPSLFILYPNGKAGPVFLMFDLNTMIRTDLPRPFQHQESSANGMDITVDSNKNELKISAFNCEVDENTVVSYYSHGIMSLNEFNKVNNA